MPKDKELRILMLEDLQDDVGLIERTLRKEGMRFSARRVDSQDEFTQCLENFRPDVILSDHALPQFNSLEALQICRKRAVNVPFILVTGTVSEEFAVSCLKQGADDYVLKSNMVRLPSAIQNALKQRHHESKRKKAENTLRKQNEELIKINKELDSFVYSVSHNLRAPLMSVLGLINLVKLEHAVADPSMDHYLQMMQQSIHKLDETLKEILDYSRNARSALNITEVNVKKMLEESFERMRYMDGSEKIQKSIEIGEDAPFYSDAYRISVIINNLVSNAIKYKDVTKDHHILKVKINVTDTQLEMIFQDNGIGISKLYLHKIFEMFYRATERSEGAGLGLYIVRETVDKLDGIISVDSALGNGTTFRIIVPNLKVHQPEPLQTDNADTDV
ncbi:MAG TPA: hybrid sensor histidine kinase/response regulator [Chryseosolibacter sp.]|nr:hybrid sensor histidine kinase/response regulator [Chryseosolibacter sp.]